MHERIESKTRDLAPLSYELLEKENAEILKKIKMGAKRVSSLNMRAGNLRQALQAPELGKLKKLLGEANFYITYLHNKHEPSEPSAALGGGGGIGGGSPPHRFVSILEREEAEERLPFSK